MNYSDFVEQAIKFLDQLFSNLAQHRISLKDSWDVDHICYRASTEQEYLFFKDRFLSFSDLLIESPVNGRLISTFKLHTPIAYKSYLIDLVELPAPKAGKTTKSGFEHIEVVCDEHLQDLAHKFDPQIVNTSGMKKDFNKELELNFGSENLKFHQLSLESVINLENNHTVFDAIKESNVLTKMQLFNPLVCGTFPLGINNDNSDVDICLTYSNENHFTTELLKNFSHCEDFKLQDTTVASGRALIATFKVKQIQFELFGQSLMSEKQNSYQHFQAEEKILKYSNYIPNVDKGIFKEKLLAARALGFKTEPAFAKVLNLKTDAFEEVLQLNKVSIANLNQLLHRNFR